MKTLKWIGIVLGSLIIITLLFAFFQIRKAEKLMQRKIAIEPISMTIPSDSVSLSIGKKWVSSMCTECHGADLGGKLFFDDPTIGTVYAPNLTRGQGGIAYYTDQKWLGALRHGISSTGRPLMIMPSQEYTKMRVEDIGGIVAYLKTIPSVDRVNGETVFKPFAKLLLAFGAFGDIFGADVIDHQAPVPENTIDQTPHDRGKYLVYVTGCQGCHGETLSGMAPGNPNSPPASNLTPGGNLANWSFDDFSNFLESGKTKEGKTVDNKFMPWQAIGKLPMEELEAIFTFLKSQDPLETIQ